jgi:hypothetical protein
MAFRVNELLRDAVFLETCEAIHIKPTRRQARKWLRKTGVAYQWLTRPAS